MGVSPAVTAVMFVTAVPAGVAGCRVRRHIRATTLIDRSCQCWRVQETHWQVVDLHAHWQEMAAFAAGATLTRTTALCLQDTYGITVSKYHEYSHTSKHIIVHNVVVLRHCYKSNTLKPGTD